MSLYTESVSNLFADVVAACDMSAISHSCACNPAGPPPTDPKLDLRCLSGALRPHSSRDLACPLRYSPRWGRHKGCNSDHPGDRPVDDTLTGLWARRLVAAAAAPDGASGAGDVGSARCRSIHPAPRARVRNGRARSRARGSRRAGTPSKALPNPMIGNRAPSRHSETTPGCGRGRLPIRDGHPDRFERPRWPPGRTSAAIPATSG